MLKRQSPMLLRQSGVMLLEALIGILIFSLGILGMIGLQAATVSAAADAQYRNEAASLADQLIAQVWLNADRTSTSALQTSLNSFQYNTTGSNCSYSGGAADSSNTTLTTWVDSVTTSSATRLPGASAAMQQVLVNTASNNLVTVTVCWRAPSDAQPRRHVMTANIS